jgi:hypothetical protein
LRPQAVKVVIEVIEEREAMTTGLAAEVLMAKLAVGARGNRIVASVARMLLRKILSSLLDMSSSGGRAWTSEQGDELSRPQQVCIEGFP